MKQKLKKKEIREKFRNEVFARDKSTCRLCNDKLSKLDAHHITNRNKFTNGGYVKSNGITLCDKAGGCHSKVEMYYNTFAGQSLEEDHHFSPNYLYKLINSSLEQAIKDDNI